MTGRRLISSTEAVRAKGQHKTPCSDCPWTWQSLNGWLGGADKDTWIRAAHSDQRIDCHTLTGAQCAGVAIYRANVCKRSRDPDVLRLPPDSEKVFATPMEFLDHHSKLPAKKCPD